MKNIFIFFTCLFMCNAVLGNCTNSEELKDVIFQNAHRIVKSNGKYIGFFLEENAKIIDFNLVKLCDKQTEVSVYALDSYIQLNVKNEDEKLKGFIEVGCLGNVNISESLKDGQVSVFVGKEGYDLNLFTRNFEQQDNIRLFVKKTACPKIKNLFIRESLIANARKKLCLEIFISIAVKKR